jgi:hypothetical protein
MAYNLENLCPATRDGAAAEDPQLVARQLAATAGEDGTTAGPALRDARYYWLLLAGAISRGGSFGSRFAGWAGSQRCPCHRVGEPPTRSDFSDERGGGAAKCVPCSFTVRRQH